jgi:hypothetical protein
LSRPDAQAIATEVVLLLKTALAPVLERLAVIEAAAPRLHESVDSLRGEGAAVRERVAILESRPPLPGPAGEPGPPGQDGAAGTPGLSYEGVYQDGKTYERGQLVTWAGSSWHCNEITTSKPGDGSPAWTLMVKRGRDGKDAVVVKGDPYDASIHRSPR